MLYARICKLCCGSSWACRKLWEQILAEAPRESTSPAAAPPAVTLQQAGKYTLTPNRLIDVDSLRKLMNAPPALIDLWVFYCMAMEMQYGEPVDIMQACKCMNKLMVFLPEEYCFSLFLTAPLTVAIWSSCCAKKVYTGSVLRYYLAFSEHQEHSVLRVVGLLAALFATRVCVSLRNVYIYGVNVLWITLHVTLSTPLTRP